MSDGQKSYQTIGIKEVLSERQAEELSDIMTRTVRLSITKILLEYILFMRCLQQKNEQLSIPLVMTG